MSALAYRKENFMQINVKKLLCKKLNKKEHKGKIK